MRISFNISYKRIKLTAFFALCPLLFFAQSLTGLWTGVLTNDSNSVRKDQSFEIALTEYQGKVYGYSRSEFIVNDTLYYVLKRVKGVINGDTCEVVDDDIISFNFPKKLDKGVKVYSSFYRNKKDSSWYLAGSWKTNKTKKYYSVTGKVDMKEEKDLSASKIFPHLEELNLANDVAFYRDRKKEATSNLVKTLEPEKKSIDPETKTEPTVDTKISVVKSAKPNPNAKETKTSQEISIKDSATIASQKKLQDNGSIAKAAINKPSKETKKNSSLSTLDSLKNNNPDKEIISQTNRKDVDIVKKESEKQPESIFKENTKATSDLLPYDIVKANNQNKEDIPKANNKDSGIENVEIKKDFIHKEETNTIPDLLTKDIAKDNKKNKDAVPLISNKQTGIVDTESKKESGKQIELIKKDEIKIPATLNKNIVNNIQSKRQDSITQINKKDFVVTKTEQPQINNERNATRNQTEIKDITKANQSSVKQADSEIKKTKSPLIDNNDKVSTSGLVDDKKELRQHTSIITNVEKQDIADAATAAAFIKERKSEFSQIVNFKSDSLEISLYDNGEIDGDTVSVLLNNEIIIAKLCLKASAFKKTVYIPADNNEEFTMVLYAENLGKYPPNTGLLVVHDGDDVYNVHFSADFQKNAGVIFRRKK